MLLVCCFFSVSFHFLQYFNICYVFQYVQYGHCNCIQMSFISNLDSKCDVCWSFGLVPKSQLCQIVLRLFVDQINNVIQCKTPRTPCWVHVAESFRIAVRSCFTVCLSRMVHFNHSPTLLVSSPLRENVTLQDILTFSCFMQLLYDI